MPVRSTARHRIQGRAGALRLPHRSTFLAPDLFLGLWWFAGAIVYIQIAPFLVEKGFTTASGGSSWLALRPNRQRFGAIGPQSNLRRRQFRWLSNERTTVIAVIVGLLGFGIGCGTDRRQRRSIRHSGAAGAMMGTVLALMGIRRGGPLVSGYVFDAVQSHGLAFYGGGAVFLSHFF